MPRLVAPNRRLGLSGRRLVTDAGGAPCCCEGGCDPAGVPECIEITLEIVETYAQCQPGSTGVLLTADYFEAPPPTGPIVLQSTAPGAYERVRTLSGPTYRGFACDKEEFGIQMQADTEVVQTAVSCYSDTLDGVTKLGMPMTGRSVFVQWTGDGPIGAAPPFGWGVGADSTPAGLWTNETRPGSSVLLAGETALSRTSSGTRNGELVSREDVRYRVSWRPVNCSNPSEGACCLPSGQCFDLDSVTCAAFGGSFRGLGTSCEVDGCPPPTPTGACCSPTGGCDEQTEADCLAGSGTYKGDNTACADVNCPAPDDVGACCLLDGRCLGDMTREDCVAISGRFSPGIGCVNVTCIPYEPRPGESACCLPNGYCAHLTDAICRLRGGSPIGQRCVSLFCSADPPQLGTAGDFF